MDALPLTTPESTDWADELERTLGREREVVREFLAAKQQQLTELENDLLEQLDQRARREAAGEEEAERERCQLRRYELAMDEVRELRRENDHLREQLGTAMSVAHVTAPPSVRGGPLNWEAEKQRVLAALESELDEPAGNDSQDRSRIEQLVASTDRVLAEKDAEITELKRVLDTQSSAVGSLAVGAAALGDILNQDGIIQEERANLAQLQEEWRAKLREAEVEISVERAKLARERLQIDEKLRQFEERDGSVSNALGGSPVERPPRNRWLSRIGLKDSESGGRA